MRLPAMKIGTRLALAFGLVLLLSALTAATALHRLAAFHHVLQDVVLDNNVKTRLSFELADASHLLARAMQTMALLEEDPPARRAERARLDEVRRKTNQALDALNGMPGDAAGRAARERIAVDLRAALAASDGFVELIDGNRLLEAKALLTDDAAPKLSRLQQAIAENIALQARSTEAQEAAASAGYESARALLVGLAVASLALAALLAWLVTRSVTRQLGCEPDVATELAHSVAAGDLSSHIEVAAGGRRNLLTELKSMQDSLAAVVRGVRENAESVATASAQIAQGNQDLSGRTEQQAAALEQTAATMDQLGTTVRGNADSARQASRLAQGASEVAVRGGGIVSSAVQTMKGINEASRRIADITGVIDAIAFQTNILALNAAVEAARAGEQGRGFAVVAGEVRSLAQRSAAAAREIKGLIAASVDSIERGTAQVDLAGATMQEVVGAIHRVTEIVGHISTASAEQSSGVAQVCEAVGDMDRTTQQNAALVEQSAAAAESLRQQAQQLLQAVSVFHLDAPTPAPV